MLTILNDFRFESKILKENVRIRIHNFELRIRILQKVADPDPAKSCGSGSATLPQRVHDIAIVLKWDETR
jgi:hypothetical protein